MEERTSSEFPTTGSTTSGLSTLEATDRADTWRSGQEEGGMREKVSGRAHQFTDKGKQYGGMARERALKSAEGKKSYFASQLDNFAGTLEEVSRTLDNRGDTSQKQLVDRGAKMVRQASQKLRNRSTEDLLDQAQGQLRERPAVAIAGAVALGFLGMRLLRS